MVFSSLPFLFIFLPITLLFFYLAPWKLKNIVLLIFSLIFYAWGEPIYIILMIFTSFINYSAALKIEKYPKRKKLILSLSIIISLFLLGFYKYGNFFIENINNLFSLSIDYLELSLPIGISFYTFQAISYVIDVYRNDVISEKNFFTFLTYISMFPQLIAGPIVRYKTINEELHNRKITYEKVTTGFLRFIRGLGKKVLLANTIGNLVSEISLIENNSIVLSWTLIIAFALQIYFDFSGYSDMGIGLGKMLGFSFLENFNYPYISTSITDFWRRWHISLSSFFKDYVYIPLGGNRVNKIRNIRNILIVWLLTGFWHGAEWNFICWGLYYGIILLIEKFVLKDFLAKLPQFFKHLYSIFLILLGWCIFYFEDMSMLILQLKNMFGFNNINFITNDTLYYLKNYIAILIIGVILSTPICKIISSKLANILNKKLKILIFILTLILYISIYFLSIIYLVDSTYNPFLYFRF